MPTVLLTANPLYGSSNQNVDARLAVNPAYTTVDGQPQCANDSVTLTVPSPAYEIADTVPAESADYANIAIASEALDHEKRDGDPRYAGYVAPSQLQIQTNTTALTGKLPVGTNNHYDVGVRRAKKDAAPLQLNDAYGNAEYAFIEEDYC